MLWCSLWNSHSNGTRWSRLDEVLQEVFGDEEDDKLQPKRALHKEPDRFRHAQEIWADCLGQRAQRPS